jgi:hypothetical protein
MDESGRERAGEGREGEEVGYEPPRVVWSEDYEPLSFGLSCAKQPGNPGCNPGPFTS